MATGGRESMDRTTVSRDWLKPALQDVGLRDIPLYAVAHGHRRVAGRRRLADVVQRQLDMPTYSLRTP